MVLEDIAPYLKVNATKQNLPESEADTGAGYRRVSSFNFLPRTQSIQSTTESVKRVSVIEIIDEDDVVKIEPDWRLKHRMKTIGVGLVLALNLGTDPPDVIKPNPCAVLECWINPKKMSRSRAKEAIGEQLRKQYAKWQLSNSAKLVKYKLGLDPTIEDVRSLCLNLRRQARGERILLHYNGHGVPKVTVNGEIWVFEKHRSEVITEYIPLSYKDLRLWMGTPSILILDCSSAGTLIPFWLTPSAPSTPDQAQPKPAEKEEPPETRWVKETIILCACSENEWLPMQPGYPADVFTCCLTTPVPIALRWFVKNNPASMGDLDPDAVDAIPGDENDRTTPLGEFNRFFIAITDSIAWDVLPKHLFQLLFRQDLLVASMFRNFLLADRIMRSLGCTPVSYPPLPSGICDHPLWHAWDLACENLLFQVMKEGHFKRFMSPKDKPGSDTDYSDEAKGNTQVTKKVSDIYLPFFTEQLTAFKVWLDFAALHKARLDTGTLDAPEQLPIILQVLLWPLHRIRALKLLRRFHDLGPWAVNLSLCSGIFPYVGKLLQSSEYTSLLVSIWASILAFDSSCRVDLLKLKDGGFNHFVKHMTAGLDERGENAMQMARERTLSTFVVALTCHSYPTGQSECVRNSVHVTCGFLLLTYEQAEEEMDDTIDTRIPNEFRLWLCLTVASMTKDNAPVQNEVYSSGIQERLGSRLEDKSPLVRASACYALGCLIGSAPKGSRPPSTQDLFGAAKQAQTFQAQRFSLPSAANVIPQNPLAAQASQNQPGQPSLPLAGAANFNWQPSLQPGVVGAPGQRAPSILQGGLDQSARQGDPSLFASTAGQSSSTRTSAPKPLRPSVFDDRRRLQFDLQAAELAAKGTDDASPIVRFEAVIALGRMVGKYLEAFLIAAEEVSMEEKESTANLTTYPIPRGLAPQFREKFASLWRSLRFLQHNDPFPKVSRAASKAVSVVHENLLRHRLERQSHLNEGDDEEGFALHTKELAARLTEVQDDGNDSLNAASSHSPTRLPAGSAKLRPKYDMRRVASEVVGSSMEESALRNQSSFLGSKEGPLTYSIPTSEFYEWQKSVFDMTSRPIESKEEREADPLSPEGATKIYLEARNSTVHDAGRTLAEAYVSLAPKPPKPERRGIAVIFDDEEDEETLLAAEVELNKKKEEIHMKETRLIQNTGVKMTSMIRFHPYEDVLLACGANDSVSVFDSHTGQRICNFLNENPRSTKLTTSRWLNDETENSLFLVGSNDGSVRIWGGFMDPDGRPSHTIPKMVSSFFACKMEPNPITSGLVCDWQQSNKTLICGGDSEYITLWDLGTQKQLSQIETGSKANVTTLTTAWDFDQQGLGPSSSGYSGIGPDVLVAGHSDGTIKVFDIRQQGSVQSPTRRRRTSKYSEHKSWVVSTTFTAYGDRRELISGTLHGEIKAWDLRLSSSVRTIDSQRSLITACAVHTKIPLVATGSSAQYIKLLTLDGDSVQVLRYHEQMANQRIGPVSCLAFHKYKPMLAAGATDTNIGIYTCKKYT